MREPNTGDVDSRCGLCWQDNGYKFKNDEPYYIGEIKFLFSYQDREMSNWM